MIWGDRWVEKSQSSALAPAETGVQGMLSWAVRFRRANRFRVARFCGDVAVATFWPPKHLFGRFCAGLQFAWPFIRTRPARIKPPPAAMLHLRLEGGMFAQDRVARRMTQGHLCYAERGVQGRSPWPPGFPPGASRAPFHPVKNGGEGGGRGGSHAQKSQFFLANRRGWLCPLCC